MNKDTKSLFTNYLIDKKFCIVFFNEYTSFVAKKLFGVEIKKGMSVLDFINEDLKETSIDLFNRAFKGEFLRKVFLNRFPTGEEFYYEFFYSPVYDSNNRVKYVSINSVDVTRNHLLEKALQDSEKRYRGIVDLQSSMLVRVDKEGNFIFVNKAYCDKFGKTEEELTGKSFVPLVHPDDLKHTLEEMKKLEIPPHRISVEQRAMTVEGWRWLHWEDVAILDKDGNIEEIQAVGRDITDYKESLRSLIETNKFLENILSSSPLAIIVIDKDNNVKFWSAGAEKIFQWKPVEAIGIYNPSIREEQKQSMKLLREKLFSGESLNEKNIERLRKDGTSVIVDLIAVPLTDSEGKVSAGLMIYDDVTQRVNTELENLKLNYALDISNAAFAVLNKNMTVESINRNFSELTEYAHEEMKGKKLKNIIAPHFSDKDCEEIIKSLEKGIVWEHESANVTKTGAIYWENITISPVIGNNGNINNYILVKEDISETKRAMQEIINTRLRLGTILNNFPELVFYEFGGKYPFISANVEMVLGYKPEEFLKNENFLESIILNADISEYLKKYNYWKSSEKNDALKSVFRCRRKNGDVVWIENTVFKITDDGGSYYCGMLLDISEAKESESKLIWNETLLRIMADSSRFGFYVANKIDDSVLYVNEKFCELCNITDIFPQMQRREVSSDFVLRRIAESVLNPQSFLEMSSKYNSPESRITFEDELQLTTGRTLRRFSSTLVNENGDYIGRFFLYEDITEKKLYDKINSTNDYKGTIEQSIYAVILFTAKGRIDSTNKMATELLGYNPYEFLTMNITDIIEDYEHDSDNLKLYDLTEGKTIHSKRKLIRKDGKRIYAEMHTKLLPNKLIQSVIWEIEIPAEDKGGKFDILINPYVNLMHKLKAFRHGEDSMNCLNRISLFFKNYEYLFESDERHTRNENEVINRFLDLIDEYNSSVNPQIEYIVSLLKRLKDDIPKYSVSENLLASIDVLETNTKQLNTKLIKLSGYMKKRSIQEIPGFKTDEVTGAIRKIKTNFKLINGLFDEHFVSDLDAIVQNIIKYYGGDKENIKFIFKSDARHKIIFNKGELFDVIKIFIENSAEACEGNNKAVKIELQTMQRNEEMILSIRDNGPGVAESIKSNFFCRGVSTKGATRGFGLSYSNTLIHKYGGKFYLDTEYTEGAGFILEFKIF